MLALLEEAFSVLACPKAGLFQAVIPTLPHTGVLLYLTFINSSVPREREGETDVGSWTLTVWPGYSGRLAKPPHA